MQDNFNLAKYLRHGNKLLNENIGGYVDLKPINELNDLGMTEEDKNSMSLEELMGTAMEMEEIENYATDDSEDEKGFDVPGDDDDFVDGFEETRENAKRAFVDAIESLRQMSFEDDDIIDMFKTAFYGK
jgi:hypothetical protein